MTVRGQVLPLFPLKLDCANILFDMMQANSGKFCCYAEYASSIILWLKTVKGLSYQLKSTNNYTWDHRSTG